MHAKDDVWPQRKCPCIEGGRNCGSLRVRMNPDPAEVVAKTRLNAPRMFTKRNIGWGYRSMVSQDPNICTALLDHMCKFMSQELAGVDAAIITIFSGAKHDIAFDGERAGPELGGEFSGRWIGMDSYRGKIPPEPGFEIRSFGSGQGLSSAPDSLQSCSQVGDGWNGLARFDLGLDGAFLLGAFFAQARSARALLAKPPNRHRAGRGPGRPSRRNSNRLESDVIRFQLKTIIWGADTKFGLHEGKKHASSRIGHHRASRGEAHRTSPRAPSRRLPLAEGQYHFASFFLYAF